MRVLHKLSSFDDDIDFRRAWRVGTVLSLVLVVVSVVAIVGRGLELGIDFEGGTSWDVSSRTLDLDDTRDALRPLGEDGAKIQVIGTGDGRTVRVQSATSDLERQRQITAALADAAGTSADDISVSTVGPAWGDEITDQAERALVFFFVAIGIYIAIRLEWKMAIGALASMVHDIAISVGFYALLQLEITPATVIAFLTILGYSLYDTIVVFDRVRENAAKSGPRGKSSYTGVVSLSLNQVLMRSINTTITSLLPVLSLLVVGAYVLGAVTIREFAIALAVGLVSGAYSSIFVAAPVTALIKEREPGWREARMRAEARRGPLDEAPSVAAEPVAVAASTVGAQPSTEGPTPSGRAIPPRPRKKGKRR